MSTSEVIARIAYALNGAEIGYMLTGSLASASYGATRSTLDIDIVIEATAAQLTKFVQSLPKAEYYVDLDSALEAHSHESLFNVLDTKSGWKIDFIIRKSRRFSQEEFSRRRKVTVQGVDLFVASVEDVIIAKLEWSRWSQSQRQLEDVTSLLRFQWQALDHPYVQKWISELHLEQQWRDAKLMAGISEG